MAGCETPPVDTRHRPLPEELLHKTVQQFRGGLVYKAHRLCVSLNTRRESDEDDEEEEESPSRE